MYTKGRNKTFFIHFLLFKEPCRHHFGVNIILFYHSAGEENIFSVFIVQPHLMPTAVKRKHRPRVAWAHFSLYDHPHPTHLLLFRGQWHKIHVCTNTNKAHYIFAHYTKANGQYTHWVKVIGLMHYTEQNCNVSHNFFYQCKLVCRLRAYLG